MPSGIISHAIWLYHRFFCEREELLTERGLTVTYEIVRQWRQKLGPAYARKLKKQQGWLGDTWQIDEAFVTIEGERHIRGFSTSTQAQNFLTLHGLIMFERRAIKYGLSLPHPLH